ncbi:MAG: Transcription factor spt20 [Alectoria sarmentosa]|nr:MAG: Transcription factor spt20 [Alectoria sarmentosa]
MKRPPLPAVQTNGVHSHQSSPSPSISTKRPPSGSGFKQPPPAPLANGVNGNINGMASRLSNRRREPQKPGDARPIRSGKGLDGQKVPKTIPAPYVKTQPYILKKYRNKPPSLIIHLHPTHFRFDQQDGSFSYSSPMKFILEHLKSQTVPHDMVEELQAAGVRFYESCLIVQVQDHKSTSPSSTSSVSSTTTKTDTNVPFSIHNYNQHLTPSPYVPYPQIDEESKAKINAPAAPSAEPTVPKDKQASKGPNVFTVVLFPTPLSLQEEVFIQANTPDLRNNRKHSVQVPRTPASATIPPTPMSAVPSTPSANGPPNKKQKMMISGQEIHEFESRAITSTAPPLSLDPVDNIDDAHKVLDNLTDPRHQQSLPAPKTRKRTVAELAADEAIAAQEQAYMLIMDERHNVSGPAAKAGTTDGEAGTATFEPRFETWQAIKKIRAEHKERAEREAEAKAHRDAQVATQKARMEQQAREHREDAIRRGRETEQQQALEIQRQNHLKEKQMRDAATVHRMQENQIRETQRQALATSQNHLNHGHPMPHGVSQAQHSSPVIRNMTPNMNSSPLVGNIPMNLTSSGQGNTSSPARPPSAMQHGHPGPGGVAMAHQRSRQPPSRTTTPLMNGTPAMPHATPVVGHATPRMNQGSPPMTANPVMNGVPNQGMNGHPQFTPQQLNEIMIRQQQQRRQADLNLQYQQRMQSGSPNAQMSPDGRPPVQNLHQLAQQNQHQVRNEYMASLQRQQQAQMQNGNVTHGMPNGGSPAQRLQQPRPPQQNPNQQPQPQQRTNPSPQQQQQQAYIQSFYNKAMQSLAAHHNGNAAAITQQEQKEAREVAISKGMSYYKQQQALLRQQQQQIANMQAMGQIPPGMNGQMNGMGAHIGGQQMSEQQRQAMMQMAQMPHMGGRGVPNVNGTIHAHTNGGGMGGMQ